MEVFAEFLGRIADLEQRARAAEVLGWVAERYPHLVPQIKWNQPMFTDHGTFIIGFSVAKHHMAVTPERAGMVHLADEIAQSGLSHTQGLVHLPWDRPVDYGLLERMIEFNIADKADCQTFWRK